MRLVNRLPDEKVERLPRSARKDESLASYLSIMVEDSMSAKSSMDANYRRMKQLYKGIPEQQFTKDIIPIRRIEITVGASLTETIYGMSYDTIFSADPLITVRGATKEYVQAAKGFQILVNHLVNDPFTSFRAATREFLLDDIGMGTGIYYTVWGEAIRKLGHEEISDRGPRVYSVDPTDLLVPGGTSSIPDLNTLYLVGYRNWMNHSELQLQKSRGWDISAARPTAVADRNRFADNVNARTREANKGQVDFYELFEIYCYYDYDGDGVDEDLYVVYDRTSHKCLYVAYSPFDTRPFSIANYQTLQHSVFGMGVMEMVAPFQREVTDWHAFRMANARLANARVYTVKRGTASAGENLRIVPNKPLEVDDARDIQALQMADIYPSALQYEMYTMQLASNRVGNPSGLSSPQQGSTPGKRVPAMTAMAIMQQMNKRFAPAFEDMRCAAADAIKQCVMRMREQYLLGGDTAKDIENHINHIMGQDLAQEVLKVFHEPANEFDDNITIEMTASTQSVNREADRQNNLMVTQLLGGYYDKLMQLSQVIASNEAPPPLKKMAITIAKGMTEALDRVLRSVNTVRDPQTFLINPNEFDQMLQPPPAAVQPGAGLDQLTGPAGAPGGGGGAAPPQLPGPVEVPTQGVGQPPAL